MQLNIDLTIIAKLSQHPRPRALKSHKPLSEEVLYVQMEIIRCRRYLPSHDSRVSLGEKREGKGVRERNSVYQRYHTEKKFWLH